MHTPTPVPDPTPEMVAFYEHRTREHIDRVRQCLHEIADATDHTDALRERARVHDASKFSDAERVPYIWLTEYHRCRRAGEPFTYPEGVHEQVRAAIRHHKSVNRHHAEYHADPNDMTDVDLIEMACDWTAMALELGDGSARGYAERTVGTDLLLSEERSAFLFRIIDLLDARLAAE